MRSSKPFLIAVVFTTTMGAGAMAARVDFNDPRRALGRQDDIRVDAELGQDTLAPNAPITVTYQIANLSKSTVAIADKVTDASFDPDTLTVTLSLGAEVPPGPNMPHLVLISPGQKRVLTAGALLHITVPNIRTPFVAVPRYVQIKVNVLRDVAPLAKLVKRQAKSDLPVPLPNDMFDRWVNNSSSIFLNTLPVYWNGARPSGASAESNQPGE